MDISYRRDELDECVLGLGLDFEGGEFLDSGDDIANNTSNSQSLPLSQQHVECLHLQQQPMCVVVQPQRPAEEHVLQAKEKRPEHLWLDEDEVKTRFLDAELLWESRGLKLGDDVKGFVEFLNIVSPRKGDGTPVYSVGKIIKSITNKLTDIRKMRLNARHAEAARAERVKRVKYWEQRMAAEALNQHENLTEADGGIAEQADARLSVDPMLELLQEKAAWDAANLAFPAAGPACSRAGGPGPDIPAAQRGAKRRAMVAGETVGVPLEPPEQPADYAGLLASLLERVSLGGGFTPLHVSADQGDFQASRQLIAAGADVNALDKAGATPLHSAAMNGHHEICELLLDAGAEANALNADQCSPLFAALEGRHETASLLLLSRGADPAAQAGGSLPALHAAAGVGIVSVCQAILQRLGEGEADGADRSYLDAGAGDGRMTALHVAAAAGNAEICTLLLENGASAWVWDAHGGLPLHSAAGCGHGAACAAILEGSDRSHLIGARMLVRTAAGGAEPVGPTPLMLAASASSAGACAALLEAEADPSECDIDGGPDHQSGNSPLHLAVALGQFESCRLLCSALGGDAVNGAKPVDAANRYGCTPLMTAANAGRADVCQLLLDFGADAAAASKDRRTPLHWAAELGHLHICALLLHRGAVPVVVDSVGKTPLIRAREAAGNAARRAPGGLYSEVCALLLESAARRPPPAARVRVLKDATNVVRAVVDLATGEAFEYEMKHAGDHERLAVVRVQSEAGGPLRAGYVRSSHIFGGAVVARDGTIEDVGSGGAGGARGAVGAWPPPAVGEVVSMHISGPGPAGAAEEGEGTP